MKFLKARKNILLLFVICITLLLSGCTNAAAESYLQTNMTQSSSQKNKSIKDKDDKEEITEVKNNVIKKEPYYITDWSIDELITSIEMNGVTYSMPFTFNDLGEEYTIEKINDNLFLYYQGENYALIKVKNNSDINNSEIIHLIIDCNYRNNDFKIGDISFGDEQKDILEKYGEPSLKVTVGSVSGLYYAFEGISESQNNALGFTFTNDKLDGISVIYNK